MRLISLELESKLRDKGLWPQSWIAWAALYVLGARPASVRGAVADAPCESGNVGEP